MLYSNTNTKFPGVACHEVFHGEVRDAYKSQKALQENQENKFFSWDEEEIEDFINNGVFVSASGGIKSKFDIAQVAFRLLSDDEWRSEIYDFDSLGLNKNETAALVCADSHHKDEDKGILSMLLYFAECFLEYRGRRHLVASVDSLDHELISCLFNTGWMIRKEDSNPNGHRLIMVKDLCRFEGVNFYLDFQRGGTYAKMANHDYHIDLLKLEDDMVTVPVDTKYTWNRNWDSLSEIMSYGYFPLDLKDGNYECYRVKGLSENIAIPTEERRVA